MVSHLSPASRARKRSLRSVHFFIRIKQKGLGVVMLPLAIGDIVYMQKKQSPRDEKSVSEAGSVRAQCL